MDAIEENAKKLSNSDSEDDEPLIKIKNTSKIIRRKVKFKKRKSLKSDCVSEKERQEAEVERLQNLLTSSESKLCKLQNDVNKLYDKYRVLNPDQIAFISNKTCNKWSSATILKSLKLFAACGPEGYAEIKRQCLPYPSVRTLQIIVDNIED